MRHILISALLLGLVSACSGVKLGPHRIDVQQGNALDQENVSRLKTGLNRSQVRFLLGTPLVVDPFRNDRWDYVYVNYKAGKLAEQKRITLFFDGDTLTRIEGDVPPPEPVDSTTRPAEAGAEPKAAAVPAATAAPAVEAQPLAPQPAPKAEPIPVAQTPRAAEPVAASTPVPPSPAPRTASQAESAPVSTAPAAAASTAPATSVAPAQAVRRPAAAAQAPAASEPSAASVETSVVAPLPSPKNAPAYRDPRKPADLALIAETDVDQVRPDVIPSFPEPGQDAAHAGRPSARDEAVLAAVRNWARAWSNRDEDAYIAAYDAEFVPPGGGARADWEQRRRTLLGVTRQIDVKIDAPTVAFLPDGSATVTFTQHYQSDSHRDTVAKQLRLVERDGRWLIADEKVVTGSRR